MIQVARSDRATPTVQADPRAIFGDFYATVEREGRRALSYLDLQPSDDLLDVGTGVGTYAIFLAREGYSVTTGEPSSDQTHYASQNWDANATAAGVRDRLNFVDFSAARMPFDEGAFAAVFFFGVLHHISEAERSPALAEALRVCRGGGAVVLFEPKVTDLPKIRARDPLHPPSAFPPDYLRIDGSDWIAVQDGALDMFILPKPIKVDRREDDA